MMRPWLYLSALWLVACQPLASVPPPAPQAWDAGIIAGAPLKPSTRFVLSSALWRQQALSAYHLAGQYVAEHQPQPDKPWGVVMDVDQTVLNNISYQIALDKSGREFSPASWRSWVDARRAPLIPGAARFIAKVRMLGGDILLVTNRRDYELAATRDNLHQFGLKEGRDYAMILPRLWPDGDSDKQSRFRQAEQQMQGSKGADYSIIAAIGDVEGDRYLARHAAFFCIPQGDLYGTPCQNHYFPSPSSK